MANITEILGTDSVSSSRPIINSNFELLNDELASVTALLNPTTSALTGVSKVTTAELLVLLNGTNLLSVNSLGAAFNTPVTISNVAKLNGTLVKSGVLGTAAAPTTQVTPTAITAITYFVEANFTLPEAVDGQEVTIINASDTSISVSGLSQQSLGATTISLVGTNSTVTLRCFNNVWYVISAYNTNIV